MKVRRGLLPIAVRRLVVGGRGALAAGVRKRHGSIGSDDGEEEDVMGSV